MSLAKKGELGRRTDPGWGRKKEPIILCSRRKMVCKMLSEEGREEKT